MSQALQAFFLLLASATDRKLAKYVEYLKAENRILRDRLPKRIQLTAPERQKLVRLGRPLGSAIRHLIGIVSPRTFMRWLQPKAIAEPPLAVGRPRTAQSLCEVVRRIAAETG